MSSPRICSLILVCFLVFSVSFVAEAQVKGKVNKGKAGYYGSPSGGGTNGGACGYGYKSDSNYTAAVNSLLWGDGFACGSCYSIKCTGNCKSKNAVVVKVNNYCAAQGTQCTYTSEPKFDLSMPAFLRLAKSLSASPLSITYQRVACPVKGAIKFSVSRSGKYISILVNNVGQYGNLQKFELKNSGSSKWLALKRVWGANWAYSGSLKFPLTLRLTSAVSKKVITTGNRCIPETNGEAVNYSCKVQF